MPDLYARAGIEDVAEFYRTKFVSDEVLDARYFRPVERFHMHFARTMWVFDNVRSGARVLDVGCGAGTLALLKRKGVELAGVDLSSECAWAARRNGYDASCRADLRRLPFADASFDYVVSLDVLGHVPLEEKTAVVGEMARVLRPGGVTMHGIECTDRRAQKSYDEMTPEELRRFIQIDGHVGLEEEEEQAARFRRRFAHVRWEPRYALCLSSEEFIKQSDEYGLPFERDFIEYLRGLSQKERRAFDMAMGYVFSKVSDLNLRLPSSGLYMFLKASDAPLGPFNNEHRDRRALFAPAGALADDGTRRCLDRDPSVHFDDGWHEPNYLPPVARWAGGRARLRFHAPRLRRLRMDLTTHMPELSRERPLGLELLLNGARLCALSLFGYGWLELEADVPEELATPRAGAFELELRADRTWQPRPAGEGRDDRELSVAVCNIEIFS
jgi:cyclopropane fatty-acyl-phospholipid synthase-like methyltransferase